MGRLAVVLLLVARGAAATPPPCELACEVAGLVRAAKRPPPPFGPNLPRVDRGEELSEGGGVPIWWTAAGVVIGEPTATPLTPAAAIAAIMERRKQRDLLVVLGVDARLPAGPLVTWLADLRGMAGGLVVFVPSPPVSLPDNPPRWALDAGQEARKETRDDAAFAAALDRALVPCPGARAKHAEIPKLAPEKRLSTYVHVATAVENCDSADKRAAETLLLLRFSPLFTERFVEVNFLEAGRRIPVSPSLTLGELVKQIAQLPSDVRFRGIKLELRRP